jgi:hypothetical protein
MHGDHPDRRGPLNLVTSQGEDDDVTPCQIGATSRATRFEQP